MPVFDGLQRHSYGDLFRSLDVEHHGDKLRTLACNPNAAIELGKAAEHLVCADLILQGYRAFLSDQGLPYDVVVDLSGRLIRIQVKASCFARDMNRAGRNVRTVYSFWVRRRGKNGDQRLSNTDCDVVALVALDIRAVAYLPIQSVGTTFQIVPPGIEFEGARKRSRYGTFAFLTFSEAIK